MNTYTVVVKSRNRVSGNQANFNIKFGHVLPDDKQVFKCRVSAMITEKEDLGDITNINTDLALSIALVADFPYINYYSTSGNVNPIAFINYHMEYQFHEFLISNINYQTINFHYIDSLDYQISADTFHESIIVLTFESVQ